MLPCSRLRHGVGKLLEVIQIMGKTAGAPSTKASEANRACNRPFKIVSERLLTMKSVAIVF